MTLKTDVLYLQKDRFEIYSSTQMRIYEFLFVPEIIQDFDVKNNDLLENLINIFIASNKISPSELIIVLSDSTCFVKDFVQPVPSQPAVVIGQQALPPPAESLQKEIDQFIQHVPFDKVASITLPLPSGVKVCATNEGLYKDLIAAFVKLGFKIDSVIPSIAYGNNLSGKTVLDRSIADFIIQSSDSVKQNNFLIKKIPQDQAKDDTKENKEDFEIIDEKPEAKNNKRVFILVGVFVLLLIVLIIVYITSVTQPKSRAANTVLPSVTPVVSPKVVASSSAELVGITPSQQEIGNLSLSIINASGSTTQGQFLKEQLNKYGFKTIVLQDQSSIGASSSIITFSANTRPAVRNLILQEVKKLTDNVQVQEKSGTNDVIEILIGK